MDRIIRFINLAMFKLSHLITSYGGLSLLAISMAYAAAFIDGMTLARFTSENGVTKMIAENPGISIEQARLMAYNHTESVAKWIIFVVASCVFYFRIAPSKNPKKPLKKLATLIGVVLAVIGVVGMIEATIANSQAHTLTEIFGNGKTLLKVIFSSITACLPTLIIEAISAQIDYEHGEKLKDVSDTDHETITESVKKSLSGVGQKRQKTTILQFPTPAKNGTNGL